MIGAVNKNICRKNPKMAFQNAAFINHINGFMQNATFRYTAQICRDTLHVLKTMEAVLMGGEEAVWSSSDDSDTDTHVTTPVMGKEALRERLIAELEAFLTQLDREMVENRMTAAQVNGHKRTYGAALAIALGVNRDVRKAWGLTM